MSTTIEKNSKPRFSSTPYSSLIVPFLLYVGAVLIAFSCIFAIVLGVRGLIELSSISGIVGIIKHLRQALQYAWMDDTIEFICLLSGTIDFIYHFFVFLRRHLNLTPSSLLTMPLVYLVALVLTAFWTIWAIIVGTQELIELKGIVGIVKHLLRALQYAWTEGTIKTICRFLFIIDLICYCLVLLIDILNILVMAYDFWF